MGLFENFPYSNFHELNLDWILHELKELETEISNFVAINSVKYANPIIWNITSQYETNTVVLDSSGNAYLSVQPVPAGVALDREEYWTKIGNFSALWDSVRSAITPYDEQHSKTASVNHKAGDWVWLENDLLLITKNITAGDKYVEGSNCEKTNVHDLFTTLGNNITNEVNTLSGELRDEITARENGDTTLDGKITTEATARAAADNALDEKITAEATARAAADNALDEKITTLVNSSGIRSVVCIGDSYAGVYPGNRWLALLKDILNIPDDKFFWKAAPGGGFANGAGNGNSFLERLTSVAETMTDEQKNAITQVIVCGGANDAGLIVTGTVEPAIKNFCAYANATFKNAEICIGFIGNAYNGETVRNYQLTMQLYRQCAGFGKRTRYLNDVEWVMYNKNYMLDDLLHPNDAGSKALATAIANCLYSGSCSVMYEYGNVALDIGNIYGSFSNGQVMFKSTSLTVTTPPASFKLNGTDYEIASGIFPFCYGDTFGGGTKIPCKILLNNSTPSTSAYIPGFLVYSAGKWSFRGYYLNAQFDWDNYTATNIIIYTEDFSTTVIE